MTALPRSTTIRSAIELKRAIERGPRRLQPIGFCPTLTEKWDKYYYGEWDDKITKEEVEFSKMVEELGDIKVEHHSPTSSGFLEAAFTLVITRPTCEFTGEIVPSDPLKKKHYSISAEDQALKAKDEAAKKAGSEATEALLKKLFEGGAISGYGDVKTQETKIDPSVRQAREIPAAEFTVGPELLDMIRKHWASHFFPTQVRVEPYKIHLYGPGGKFKAHQDTPETDLVGTFLVGLGDTTKEYSGHLLVKCLTGWEFTKAYCGSWVAFYPDVKHEVAEITEGYRAVVAFKIFRPPGSIEAPAESSSFAKINAVFEKMPKKFGLLLERQYCKGTTQMSGFDAELLAVAKARADREAYILPVLTKFDALMYEDFGANRKDDKIGTEVFPFMEPHVRALLQPSTDAESDSSDSSSEDEPESGWLGGDRMQCTHEKKPLALSLKGTEATWIEERHVHDVPFYIPDVHNSLVKWRSRKQEGAEHTGNESRPTTEDSIYLSYSMVVLPKASHGEKRKLEDVEEVSE